MPDNVKQNMHSEAQPELIGSVIDIMLTALGKPVCNMRLVRQLQMLNYDSLVPTCVPDGGLS